MNRDAPPREQLTVDWRELIPLVTATGGIERHQQHGLALEAEADVSEREHVTHEQSRGGQQHDGQRHLRDDEAFADEPPRRCVGRGPGRAQ